MSDDLQAALATLHDAFAGEKAELTALLGKIFADPAQATDALLSAVEEFGPQHAIDRLNNAPDQIDTVAEHPDTLADDQVQQHLSRLVDLQDQLDEIARGLDLQDANRPRDVRRLNIQGQPYVFDGASERLRPDKEAGQEKPKTYAEQLSQELGVPLAEPNPDHDRDRSRRR